MVAFFFFFFDLDTVDRCESDWRISERIDDMHEDLSRFRMPSNDAIRKDIYRSAACGSVPSKTLLMALPIKRLSAPVVCPAGALLFCFLFVLQSVCSKSVSAGISGKRA